MRSCDDCVGYIWRQRRLSLRRNRTISVVFLSYLLHQKIAVQKKEFDAHYAWNKPGVILPQVHS